MESRLIPLLIFLLFINLPPSTSTTTNTCSEPPLPNADSSMDFITTSCNKTNNKEICTKSLAPYSSIIKQDTAALIRIAINVSFDPIRELISYMSNVSSSDPNARMKDSCREYAEEAYGRLKEAAAEAELLEASAAGSDQFQSHIYGISNSLCWVAVESKTCLADWAYDDVSDAPADIRNAIYGAMPCLDNAMVIVAALDTSRLVPTPSWLVGMYVCCCMNTFSILRTKIVCIQTANRVNNIDIRVIYLQDLETIDDLWTDRIACRAKIRNSWSW